MMTMKTRDLKTEEQELVDIIKRSASTGDLAAARAFYREHRHEYFHGEAFGDYLHEADTQMMQEEDEA